MRLKLDENLGERGRRMLVDAGHDVATVAEQRLSGAEDIHLIEACASERRCLVTLDLDFSNPFRFQPERFAGIAVLRLPRRVDPSLLHKAVETLIKGLARRSVTGKLWIVDLQRIREHIPGEDEVSPSS